MAKFRMVHTAFWSDPKTIEEMTPEDKYFFLYLLTNPNTKQIGIYQITKKQMAFDMGYSMETINALLDRFISHHEIVTYNNETREIAIKNWGKFNLNRGGKPMEDCVVSELKDVKDLSLIRYVGERVENAKLKAFYDTYHDTPTTSGQEEDKEEEEEEEEETISKVQEIYNHYLSKSIINHKTITSQMRSAINARLKDYSFEQLIESIDNYATIYSSKDYWFDTKYTLTDLMRDKDVRKFIDDAEPLKNFKGNGFNGKSGIADIEYDPDKDSF